MSPERRQMRCDPCLVVGTAATVQPAVALGRLERRRLPLTVLAFGLYVVMGVQQYRRGAGRGGGPGGDGRGAALAGDLPLVQNGLGEKPFPPFCAAPLFRPAGWGPPHRFVWPPGF